MSLPLFSSFFSALNVFTDSSTTAVHKPGHDSLVRAVQVGGFCRTNHLQYSDISSCLQCNDSPLPFHLFFQEVRQDLERQLRSDAHQLAGSLLADALARHTWSVEQQLAVIDRAECADAARGSEVCVHSAFQNAMLQHMDGCFGFNLGSKPAPSISVRALSVGSVSSATAVDISRAFIAGCF